MNDITMSILTILTFTTLAITILLLDNHIKRNQMNRTLEIMIKQINQQDIKDKSMLTNHIIQLTNEILFNQMLKVLITNEESETIRDELHEVIAIKTSDEDGERIYELTTRLKGVKPNNRHHKNLQSTNRRRKISDIIMEMRQLGFLEWQIARNKDKSSFGYGLKDFRTAVQNIKYNSNIQTRTMSQQIIRDIMKIIIEEFYESTLTIENVREIVTECVTREHFKTNITTNDEGSQIEDPRTWIQDLNRANAWRGDKLDYCNHRNDLCCFARLTYIKYNANFRNEIIHDSYMNLLSRWMERIELRKALKIMLKSEGNDKCPHEDERSINKLGSVCSNCRCRGWTDHYVPYTPTDSENENEGVNGASPNTPTRANLGVKRKQRLLL